MVIIKYALFVVSLITIEVLAMGTKPINQNLINSKEKINTMNIKIQEINTPKGFSIWFVPCKDLPVITIGIGFKNAGDAYNKAGVVQLLTQMLQEGAGDLTSREFKDYLLEKKITLKIYSDVDNFFITLRTIKENAHCALKLLQKILEKPLFAENDLRRVKEQLLQYLQQSLHDEHSVAYENFLKFLLKDHPYVKDVKKDIQSIEKLTSHDLNKFMKDRFCKDNIFIAVAGNIEKDDLVNYVDETLNGLPDKSLKVDIKPTNQNNLGEEKHYTFPIPQSVIYFAQPGVDRHHPDFYAFYLLNSILGGPSSFETELWKEIREKRGLAYYISTNVIFYKYWNSIVGSTGTNTKDVKEAIHIIRQKWKEISEKGISEEQLQFQKKYLIGSFPLSFASTKNIVTQMLNYQAYGLPKEYVNQRNQILEKITLQDVNRVAKQYLDSSKLSFVVLGK